MSSCFHSHKKHYLLLFLLVFYCGLFAQETSGNLKTISGLITHLETPLPEVNISILNSKRGTKSDKNGHYEIKAKVGETIVYSHLSMKSQQILVEDVTKTLNIKMVELANELDEVVVKGLNQSESILDMHAAMDVNLETPLGLINPASLATTVHYVDNRDIRHFSNTDLVSALGGRFSGLENKNDKFGQPRLAYRGKFIQFDIDGLLYENDPGLIFENIEHMWIIKTRLLVVIRTKESKLVKEQRLAHLSESNKNQNYYQNDALAVEHNAPLNNEPSIDKVERKNIITGTITNLKKPLANVSIKIKDSRFGTETNNEGKYSLMANPGDIIEYTHIAYKPLRIVVEDVTNIVNVEMVSTTNILNEVTVTAKTTKGKVYERALKANEVFSTSRGNIDPKRAGYAVSYMDGDDIVPSTNNILDVLTGKFAGVIVNPTTRTISISRTRGSINQPSPPIWDIDNQIFTQSNSLGIDAIISIVDVNNIKDIHILKGLAATNKYGSIGSGGVIVIRHKFAFYDRKSQGSLLASKNFNSNFYANDAIAVDGHLSNSNELLKDLKTFQSREQAFEFYIDNIKESDNDYSLQLKSAKIFLHHFKDTESAKKILSILKNKHAENPEILKAIAYHYQAYGLKREAIKTYQDVFYLRSGYAQSFRDVANAYIENEQFKQGWRIYMNYLLEGNETQGEGIGPIVFNEMEYLYFNRSNQTAIKQTFVPKNENHNDFKNDLRIVVEWNTSEAEFDLEFVNPEKRAYVFEHSLAANEDLIFDEKTKGYSSKEFLLDDIGKGEWLVNLTYLGNKRSDPTYLKMTTYYNWGQYNQRSEINVYELFVENKKVQLLRINEKQLLASN